MTEVVEPVTSHGLGRWHIDEPPARAIGQLAIGHGAGGGVASHDLDVVSTAMVGAGFRVGRFEQPWRAAGRRLAGPPAHLDAAWCDAMPAFADPSLPLIVGGRSAGARVACRTSGSVGALAVVALAFPLHPPGRPEKSRVTELPALPVLVVQGDRDAFGSANEVLAAGSGFSCLTVLRVPGADHSLRVGTRGPITQREADEILALGVRRWTLAAVRGNHR
jgi:predicted alpha/beta-hydrolase family hydrolase